jgi:hypothetical protein
LNHGAPTDYQHSFSTGERGGDASDHTLYKTSTAYGWDIAVLTMHPHYYAADTRMDEALLTQLPQDIAIYRTRPGGA